jgi:capsular polysaccharide biosynthesis protein
MPGAFDIPWGEGMREERSVLMNQEKSDYDEIDLIDLFRIVLNSWKLIAVIFLLSIVIVGSVTYFWLPKKYRSEALFYLEADGGYGSTFGKAEMVKDVIQTNYFLRSILEKNDLETSQGKIEQLGQAITISQTEAGNIALELIWDDPQQAYALLSSVYDGYKDEVARRITNYTTSKLELAEAQLERSKEVAKYGSSRSPNTAQADHPIRFIAIA